MVVYIMNVHSAFFYKTHTHWKSEYIKIKLYWWNSAIDMTPPKKKGIMIFMHESALPINIKVTHANERNCVGCLESMRYSSRYICGVQTYFHFSCERLRRKPSEAATHLYFEDVLRIYLEHYKSDSRSTHTQHTHSQALRMPHTHKICTRPIFIYWELAQTTCGEGGYMRV